MITEHAFLFIFSDTILTGIVFVLTYMVIWKGCRWRAVDKPAAPQVVAGSIFLPFLSFSLCPLLLATLICFSLFTMPVLLQEYSLSEAGNKPFLDFSWTIRWPSNISSLCVVLMVDWSHLACLVNSYVLIRGLLKGEVLEVALFYSQTFL